MEIVFEIMDKGHMSRVNRNNNGPNMDPCGTPERVIALSKPWLLVTTACFLPSSTPQGSEEDEQFRQTPWKIPTVPRHQITNIVRW
ncbi:hypothetical protein Trydic_g14292 [Trypoxylus dichotomus]